MLCSVVSHHEGPTGRFVLDIEHRDPSPMFERAPKQERALVIPRPHRDQVGVDQRALLVDGFPVIHWGPCPIIATSLMTFSIRRRMDNHTMRYGACQEVPYANVWTMAKKDTPVDRLGPDDWTIAALAAIADNGIANVAIERIAKQLGATKGSFYWHFKDRSALIAAALDLWERHYTDDIIERLASVEDPRERFRGLLESAFHDHPGVLIDANLLAFASDEMVGQALKRVAKKRLGFVGQIFAQADASGGADRALLAYSAYIGLSQLRRTAPSLTPKGKHSAAYIANLVSWLMDD